jgi:hypothetical protein
MEFGLPKTYVNRSGNDVTEWADGLKVVRMADGRVKVGRQGSKLRDRPVVQQFRSGSNPTAHVIVAFDDLD